MYEFFEAQRRREGTHRAHSTLISRKRVAVYWEEIREALSEFLIIRCDGRDVSQYEAGEHLSTSIRN